MTVELYMILFSSNLYSYLVRTINEDDDQVLLNQNLGSNVFLENFEIFFLE